MNITFSQRHMLAGVILTLAAAAIWVMFLRDYMRVGTDADPQWPASSYKESDNNATEFEYFSNQDLVPTENSRVIAEQNMFSSARKEWAPPQSKPETAPSGGASGPVERIRPDIELRGVSFVEGKPWAIVRFLSFKPEETKVLQEGEYVSVPGGAGNAYLLLEKVEPESVVIKDQDGSEYTIGLHDHRREVAPSTPVESIVIIGSAVAKPEAKAPAPPAKAPVKPAAPVRAKKAAPQKAP